MKEKAAYGTDALSSSSCAPLAPRGVVGDLGSSRGVSGETQSSRWESSTAAYEAKRRGEH